MATILRDNIRVGDTVRAKSAATLAPVFDDIVALEVTDILPQGWFRVRAATGDVRAVGDIHLDDIDTIG